MDVSSSPWGANMTVRPIKVFSDPSLRNVAEPVTVFDRSLRDLVKALTVTMRAGSGRAGLAAPQIGAPVRVLAYEACLSEPGVWWPLQRAFSVVARGRDAYGKPVTVRALGMLARVLQHEVDHLDGVLFIDHLPAEDRERFLSKISSSA
jgi:peptide deformylase